VPGNDLVEGLDDHQGTHPRVLQDSTGGVVRLFHPAAGEIPTTYKPGTRASRSILPCTLFCRAPRGPGGCLPQTTRGPSVRLVTLRERHRGGRAAWDPYPCYAP
jgi:hypothetical protein